MRVVVFALLLASCGRGGAEIIVDPHSVPVTRVGLFVGIGDEKEAFLIPASKTFYPSVAAWARDHDAIDMRDVVDGQPVTFQLVDAPDDQLGAVIAVGYTADGAPKAAAGSAYLSAPSDAIARYTLNLHALDTTLGLEYWQSPTTSTCVALVIKPGATDQKVIAVLDPNDPDCDGYTETNHECAPTFYKGIVGPTLDQVECLHSEPLSSGISGCTLGGPSCTDGTGLATGCTASSGYCLPGGVCEACATYACAQDITPTPIRPPYLACTIQYTNNNICQDAIDAVATMTQLGQRTCNTDTGVRITRGGSTTWSDKISYQQTNLQLQIVVQNLEPTCNFQIVPSGNVGAYVESVGGLVAAKLDNGRGVAMPIVFSFQQTTSCGSPQPCTLPLLPTTDSFYACIDAAPTSP